MEMDFNVMVYKTAQCTQLLNMSLSHNQYNQISMNVLRVFTTALIYVKTQTDHIYAAVLLATCSIPMKGHVVVSSLSQL